MKASSNFKLMMLSSTIKTLIGGTEPSRSEDAPADLAVPPGDLAPAAPFIGVGFLLRRGLAGRKVLFSLAAGVGGVPTGLMVGGASGAGGVGSGGAAGMVLG